MIQARFLYTRNAPVTASSSVQLLCALSTLREHVVYSPVVSMTPPQCFGCVCGGGGGLYTFERDPGAGAVSTAREYVGLLLSMSSEYSPIVSV